MKKFIWTLRAALYMRKRLGWWKPKDLSFCWKTASTIYFSYEYDDRVEEIGDPAEEIAEELSCWGE